MPGLEHRAVVYNLFELAAPLISELIVVKGYISKFLKNIKSKELYFTKKSSSLYQNKSKYKNKTKWWHF
jgi:hypothetical protein